MLVNTDGEALLHAVQNGAFWECGLATAEELLDWFIAHAESHSLGPYLAVGGGYKGLLAVRRGDARGGVESLQGALAELHSARYELLTAIFNISLVQGLSAIGRFAEAITLIDEAIRLVEANGELSHMAELLRVKGNVVLSMGRPSGDAQMCFYTIARIEPSSRRESMGVADCDRPRRVVGRSGTARSCPRAASADFRAVYGRLRHGRL